MHGGDREQRRRRNGRRTGESISYYVLGAMKMDEITGKLGQV